MHGNAVNLFRKTLTTIMGHTAAKVKPQKWRKGYKMKKFISILLVLSMVFGMSTSVFAGTEENSSASLISVIKSGADEINNNHFKYYYKTTNEKLLSEATITKESLKTLEATKAIGYYALEKAGLLGYATELVIEIGSIIYGKEKVGKIYCYRATKKKIKVNTVTGNESVVGEWWTVTLKYVPNDGEPYSRTNTYRVK